MEIYWSDNDLKCNVLFLFLFYFDYFILLASSLPLGNTNKVKLLIDNDRVDRNSVSQLLRTQIYIKKNHLHTTFNLVTKISGSITFQTNRFECT